MVALLETIAPRPRLETAGGRPDHFARAVGDAVIDRIVDARLPDGLERAVRAQFAAHDGGSSLFGLLALYSYEAAGGERAVDAMGAATAMEFVMAAASVLDDLQDLDPVPGIDSDEPGAGAELVAVLMAMAQQAIVSLRGSGGIPDHRVLDVQARLSWFELRALAGQHEANRLGDNGPVSLEQSSRSTEAKSGSIGRLAAELGAALATGDVGDVELLGQFGEHLAIIDQMQNDIAGVWPGGAPSTDIELGRRTQTMVFALEVPTGVSHAADEVKSALRARSDSGQREETKVREALFRSGAVHYAWIVAAVHKAKASLIAGTVARTNPNSRIGDLLAA